MGFIIDIFQIPNDIYASRVNISHDLKSQQYDENIRSLIRKYASRLSDFYYIRLDTDCGRIIKKIFPNPVPKGCRFEAVFDELTMSPLNFGNIGSDDRYTTHQWCNFTIKDIPTLLQKYWEDYLKMMDDRSWNWMMRFLIIAYRLWAYERLAEPRLWFASKSNESCNDNVNGFGDKEFWEYVLFGKLMPDTEWEKMHDWQDSRRKALGF